MTTDEPGTLPRRHGLRRHGLPVGRIVEAIAVVVAAVVVVLATHDVRYVLTHPYWLDEAWVAVSARLPVGDLMRVTSSTPPGWTLLHRPFAALGEQGGRALPLLFIVGLVVAAYYAATSLASGENRVGRVVVGAAAGFGVAIVPMTLIRNDLKQYTADGCVALVLIAIASGARRREWRITWLCVLAVVAVVAFTVSITTIFVFAAIAATWLIDVLVRRRWRMLARGLVPFAAGTLACGALYVALYTRATNAVLNAYWADYYPTARAAPGFVLAQVRANGPGLLLGHWWLTAFGVALAVALLLWRSRNALGLLPLVLGGEMVVVGVVHKYPLLDTRTSYFLFVVMTFFACVGGAGVVVAVLRAAFGRRQVWAMGAAVAVVAVGCAGVGVAAWPQARSHSIPDEDARDQIAYVAAHHRPGDIVLLNRYAAYSMGYYWQRDEIGWRSFSAFATGFQITFPANAGIIVANDDDPRWVTDAARRAASAGGTLWVIQTHTSPTVARAWDAAGPLDAVETGPEPLGVIPAR